MQINNRASYGLYLLTIDHLASTAWSGLGQREAARLLKLHQVKLSERQFRHYLSGKQECPEVVYRALRDLANELSNT